MLKVKCPKQECREVGAYTFVCYKYVSDSCHLFTGKSVISWRLIFILSNPYCIGDILLCNKSPPNFTSSLQATALQQHWPSLGFPNQIPLFLPQGLCITVHAAWNVLGFNIVPPSYQSGLRPKILSSEASILPICGGSVLPFFTIF